MESDNSSDENIMSVDRYLSKFNSLDNGPLHEQEWAVKNIQKFHRTLQIKIYQCRVCKEAWPLTSNPGNPNSCDSNVHVVSETNLFLKHFLLRIL